MSNILFHLNKIKIIALIFNQQHIGIHSSV